MTSQNYSNELALHSVHYEQTTPPHIIHSIEWDNEAKSYHVLNELFLQAPACIALLQGPEHRFVLANPFFCQTVGRQNLLGKRCMEALPYLVGQGFIEILDLVYTTGTSYIGREVPVRINCAGAGLERYFTFVYQPMRNSSGRVDSIFVHGVDITKQVQTHKRVEQFQEETQQVQDDLIQSEYQRLRNEYAEAHERELALQEINQQKDTFLQIVNHELKAPLTTASTSLQFAQKMLAALNDAEVFGEESITTRIVKVQKLLATTSQQMEIQARLIHDLLEFSSIQANQLRLQKSTCDLVKIVHDTIEEQQKNTTTHTFHLDSQGNASILLIADSVRIKQVLTNYLKNAIKYSLPTHMIHIAITLQDSLACVQVQDEGPGLLPEEVDKIWERSYQGFSGKQMNRQGAGMGIGLYVCRMIIQQHQGQVGAENVPTGGALFWFTLPLTSS